MGIAFSSEELFAVRAISQNQFNKTIITTKPLHRKAFFNSFLKDEAKTIFELRQG